MGDLSAKLLSPKLLIALLRPLPRNAMSRLAGRLASLRLPQPLQRWLILGFARTFGVDLDEVRDPLESFPSIQAFFTRALAEGSRPIDGAPEAFVAPCDGAWGEAGRVEGGLVLQLKGRPYSLAQLLGCEEAARSFEGGSYATFYLSPRDYHRFHAPCAARVEALRYVPGSLWPVNRAGLLEIDGLFAQNERICAFMEPVFSENAEGGAGGLCLVAVGATMVGKIRLSFDDLSTNRRAASRAQRSFGAEGPRLAKGEEWGRFEFGSTLVALAAPGLLVLDEHPPGQPLAMGQRIGTLRSTGNTFA
ncbi:MAG: phosphatidylserine decarboxylase [Deltaproteobacteria bacterium]|nr:phosphatidylserine decarboxylase [Deltaproteobacteria bacterium]MBW2417686.1 phosphatidylserine decarboxylase [Deltaproteobacteria bacterium]